MHDDQTFRVVMIAIVAIVFPIGIYHRIRARSGERLDRRQEGVFILATLRPIGILLGIAGFAYMISPESMSWSSMHLPPAIRWMGVALAIGAGAALTWTLRSIGPNLTDTVVTRRQHALVMHGPYRWVRHPFYDCVALLMLGVALTAANWAILIGAVAVFSLLVLRTSREEANLVARFGDTYRTYMRSTGRFFPRLRARSPQPVPERRA